MEGSSRADLPNSSREIFFSFAIRRNTAPAETCRIRKACASRVAYVDLPVPCGPLTVMIMWKRWRSGRGRGPRRRDSSGTRLLQTAWTAHVRSSSIFGASSLGLREAPYRSGNIAQQLELSAQNVGFFFLTVILLAVFFGRESSDAGLSLRISRRRGH